MPSWATSPHDPKNAFKFFRAVADVAPGRPIQKREALLSTETVWQRRSGRARTEPRASVWGGLAQLRDGTENLNASWIVREVAQLGMEVCVTLGEIGPTEARKLKGLE